MGELVLFLVFVILILVWKITYASPRPHKEQHDCHVETDEDRNGECDSNEEENTPDTRDRNVGSDSLTDSENEGTNGSHEEDDDTMNDAAKHRYDEQQIFEAYVDKSILDEFIKKSGRLSGLMDYISVKREEWEEKKINIAITGNAGAGKSSLINAIIGLRPSAEGAANVGITETTTEIKQYRFPGKVNLVMWDLPGIGKCASQKEEYLSKCDISRFDVLIIVSSARFIENDIWLAREVLKREKYVFFVRTKIDIDLENEKHDHPHQFDASRCLKAVKKEIHQNLKKGDLFSRHAKVYVVSSRQTALYDFPEMHEELKNLLNMKGVCMQKHLKRLMEAATIKESENKKRQFLFEAIESIFDILQFSLSSKKLMDRISRTRTRLEKAFCIDDHSLERVSRETLIAVEDLKANHLNYFKDFEKNVNKWYNPWYGDFLNGFCFYRCALHVMCDLLAEDECILINLRIKSLEKELLPM